MAWHEPITGNLTKAVPQDGATGGLAPDDGTAGTALRGVVRVMRRKTQLGPELSAEILQLLLASISFCVGALSFLRQTVTSPKKGKGASHSTAFFEVQY